MVVACEKTVANCKTILPHSQKFLPIICCQFEYGFNNLLVTVVTYLVTSILPYSSVQADKNQWETEEKLAMGTTNKWLTLNSNCSRELTLYTCCVYNKCKTVITLFTHTHTHTHTHTKGVECPRDQILSQANNSSQRVRGIYPVVLRYSHKELLVNL